MTSTRHLPLLFAGRSLVAALAMFSTNLASAHSVWIEILDGKLVVRFGEVGDKYLDQLSRPKVVDAKGGTIAVEKGSDFFLLKDAKPVESPGNLHDVPGDGEACH